MSWKPWYQCDYPEPYSGTYVINGQTFAASGVPEHCICFHLKENGPQCLGNCYTRTRGGRYKCVNSRCIGHPTKGEDRCFGDPPLVYHGSANLWRRTRGLAKQALPAAGKWALEVIVDFGLVAKDKPEGWMREVVSSYENGHPSTGTRIYGQNDNTFGKVEEFRTAVGLGFDMSQVDEMIAEMDQRFQQLRERRPPLPYGWRS